MVFVFGLVLVDVIILVIYTTLVGAITHFRVGTDINEEKPIAYEGVSWTSIPFMTVLSLPLIGFGNQNRISSSHLFSK